MATNIKTIKSLSYDRLKGATHDEFAQFTLAAIVLFPVIGSRFTRNVELLRKAATKEHDAFLWTQQKLMTEQLNEYDKERIASLRYLRDLAKALTLGPNPGLKLAAKKVLLAIDVYGGTKIQSQSVEQRTGSITNLLDDLEVQLAEEVEVLEITAAVETLKENNERFILKYSERTQALAEHGVGILAELRVETDRCLRLFFGSVNIAAQSGEYSELKPFMDYMNIEISRLRTLIKQKSSRTTNPGTDEEVNGDETETEDEVTLTFKKEDETTITLTGMPGESYEIPPLPDGKIWVSDEDDVLVPNGIFPAEDATFIEVALGERKSVVFHFLSGEHETFTGLPGTEYVVPDTDEEDCEWSPVPTGVIPDVDTQYFETRVPAEEEEDERPKYRITYRAEGRVVATQEYYEGETIVPPACPEGFEWPDDLPEVMPARNLVILGVEID